MANYVIYTRNDKSEIKLKLDSERTIELEEHLGGSIPQKLPETEKMSVAVEFIASAIPDGEYQERKKTALEMYDEMVADGKMYSDYLELIHRILAAGGFINGGTVDRQIEIQKETESLEELADRIRIENIRKMKANLENPPAETTEVSQN